MSELASLLPFVGIALLFWLLMIRPAQRRQRELRQMQSALAVGDEVMLTSGIYGTVHAVDDDRVQVEVAPGVVVSVAPAAVGAVTPTPPTDDEHHELSEGPERSDVGTDTEVPQTTTEDRTGER